MLTFLSYIIPPSYYQRTVGLQTFAFNQKTCGSCWAAVVASAADTMLLRQSQVLKLPETTETLRVSTQWIMQNSPSNDGCGGGNFIPAVKDLQKLNGSFGRESDFPYKGGESPAEINAAFSSYDQFYSSSYTPFAEGSEASNKLKFYISRGLAVAGEMSISSLNFIDKQFTNAFNGELLSGKCNGNIDHQIQFVGYGNFKGVPVWVIKTSWSSGYG